MAFISSFKYSYIANVTIIYATAPFIAALLAWLLIGSAAPRPLTCGQQLSRWAVFRSWCFSGVHTGGYFGDGAGHCYDADSVPFIWFIIRIFRDAPVVWASAVSAFLLFLLGWFVTDPLAVTSPGYGLCLSRSAPHLRIAVVLWTEGARLVPAAEAALLGFGEVPFRWSSPGCSSPKSRPRPAVIGGAIVLAAVLWHAGRDLRESRNTDRGTADLQKSLITVEQSLS